MAVPLRMKRMMREREVLETPNDDYFVYFKDDNLFDFHAYIHGPSDSLYAHKFVKLRIEIPPTYPMVPPKCTFIQHSGGRMHPNLYVGGKVCLSILGTWTGEKWAFSMNINTVLITIRSLLDNSPYKHEPGQKDHPDFNKFVQYTGWQSLFFDHLKNEEDHAAKAFLEKYVSKTGPSIIDEVKKQLIQFASSSQLRTPYPSEGKSQTTVTPDYHSLLKHVTKVISQCQAAEALRGAGKILDGNQQDVTETAKKASVDNNSKRSEASPGHSNLPSKTSPTLQSEEAEGSKSSNKLKSGVGLTSSMPPNQSKSSSSKQNPDVIDLTKTLPPKKAASSSSPKKKSDVIDLT